MENKFRGKTEDGHWIYGGVAYYSSKASNRAYIVDERLTLIPVKPETVGQFTGTYDCDNKEIYAGDIIQSTFCKKVKFIVCYEERRRAFVNINKFGDDSLSDENAHGGTFKVVGNKFDNPEL